MSLSNPFSEDSRYQYSFKLIATVTAAQDLHKIKPDNVPAWRMGKRHKNPTLTKSSNPYLLEKRKPVFPSRVSLGISTNSRAGSRPRSIWPVQTGLHCVCMDGFCSVLAFSCSIGFCLAFIPYLLLILGVGKKLAEFKGRKERGGIEGGKRI